MKILVCGAKGFVGRALVQRLRAQGHEVVPGVRRARSAGELAFDYSDVEQRRRWAERLRGFDAVVNAVGILVERRTQRFRDVHDEGPRALFEACVGAGVARVVQVSALGADRGGSAYFTSKRAADEALLRLPLAGQVVRPALIYGEDGASARMFRLLASLPIVFLPAGGHQRLQPVHIDDVTEAIARLLAPQAAAGQCVELVGPEPVEYRDMLRIYRAAMRFEDAFAIAVPAPLIALAAQTIGRLPGAILTPDTWRMLQEGNTGDPAATTALLGRAPRALRDFIPAATASLARERALADWRTPLLRAALAVVWVVSGLTSAFVYPTAQSLALLYRVGISGPVAVPVLIGAAALDIALGVATWKAPSRRLWLVQIAFVLACMVAVALRLPEFYAHPFGPMTKNLPILAILFVLLAESRRPWTRT